MISSRALAGGICAVLAAMVFAVPAQADPTYEGELTVGSGLIAAEDWDDSGTSLHWEVTYLEELGKWHYEYTLTVADNPGISHMIIEVSDDDPGPAFTEDNLFSPSADPFAWIGEIEIGDYDEDNGNPNMEGSVYGVKFNAADDMDALEVTVSFDSDRVPVWGDFYAKGGNDSSVFNEGFDADDPTDGPDADITDHILVPDTTTVTVPAPGAILLGGLGTAMVSWLRRRRTF